MDSRTNALRVAALCAGFAIAAPQSRAADVTYQRLLNPEPQKLAHEPS